MRIALAWMVCLGLAACAPNPAPGLGAAPVSQVPTHTIESTPNSSAATQESATSLSATSLPATSPQAAAFSSPAASATLPASPTPPACLIQGGRFEQGSVRDGRLPLPLEYFVYLPPCYDQELERRFPVLYLIHGQNYDNDQWDRLGADEALDKLVASGEVSPFIIVLPRDRSWSQPTEDAFGDVLVEKLIPTIDESYRTKPERASRAVGGLSRGGGWAIHLGLSHWELFGAVGAHSLAVFWADTYHIRDWLAAIPPASRPRIFLDIGEKDRPPIMQSAAWFEKLLTDKGIPHEWHLYLGYHEEAYWQAHVEEYLRWYAQGW